MKLIKALNLAFHFILELCMLAALVTWGFQTGQGWLQKALLGIGVPLLAAVLWGVFRVPNDPGPATVAVPGFTRLAIELGLFAVAIWALSNAGHPSLATAFAFAVVIDYGLMYERFLRLLKRP
jgi:Protein of unknown function (DUF2568)